MNVQGMVTWYFSLGSISTLAKFYPTSQIMVCLPLREADAADVESHWLLIRCPERKHMSDVPNFRVSLQTPGSGKTGTCGPPGPGLETNMRLPQPIHRAGG